MFCVYCGHELADGYKFCTFCGKPVKREIQYNRPDRKRITTSGYNAATSIHHAVKALITHTVEVVGTVGIIIWVILGILRILNIPGVDYTCFYCGKHTLSSIICHNRFCEKPAIKALINYKVPGELLKYMLDDKAVLISMSCLIVFEAYLIIFLTLTSLRRLKNPAHLMNARTVAVLRLLVAVSTAVFIVMSARLDIFSGNTRNTFSSIFSKREPDSNAFEIDDNEDEDEDEDENASDMQQSVSDKDDNEEKVEIHEIRPDTPYEALQKHYKKLLSEEGFIADTCMTAPYVFVGVIEQYDIPIVSVGNFAGQEGILGAQILDLSGDEVPELLVLRRDRKIEEDTSGFPEGNIVWTLTGEAYYINGNNTVESAGQVILDVINDQNDEYSSNRAGGFETRVFLKEYEGRTYLCSSSSYDAPIGADGFSVFLRGFEYADNAWKAVVSEKYCGSDGFNEDRGFSSAAQKLGLDITAERWQDNDYIYLGDNPYIVSDNEPDCTDLIRIKTESEFNDEVLMERPRGPFDEYELKAITNCSMEYGEAETVIDSGDHDE